MTRKHFVAIAANIRAKRNLHSETPAHQYVIDDLARELAGTFASTNSSFNRTRFLDACGVER